MCMSEGSKWGRKNPLHPEPYPSDTMGLGFRVIVVPHVPYMTPFKEFRPWYPSNTILG